MSWRIVVAVLVTVFLALLLSMTMGDPLRMATDAVVESDSAGQNSDAAEMADTGIRAFENLIYIIVFGSMAWGAWYIFRREITRGGGL